MEWWVFLIGFFGILMIFIFSGIPIAFSFLAVNFIFVTFIMGFHSGMNQLVLSVYDSLAQFSLTTIPLFVLMGELLLHSGMVVRTLDVLSKLLGKLPGRLSILSVVSGSLFASLSGSSIANTSMLGTLLVPEMRKRGYHKGMILGPIMASGSLAVVMPHSSAAILMGSIGKISIGELLIATIIPGILMSIFFIVYIVIVCLRKPELAPKYEVEEVNWQDRINSLVVGVIPMAILIIGSVALIFFGIATPTESAGLGALGALLLVIAYRRFTRDVLVKSIKGTLHITGMILLIIASSSAFSQLLSFTGATRALIDIAVNLHLPSLVIIGIMLILIVILGCFIEAFGTMMLTIPVFIPMVIAMHYDPIWFGILMLICIDMGNLAPPFGLLLFVMKGVTSKDITMQDIYKSITPFILIEALLVILIMLMPMIALWLPGLISH